MPPREVSPGPDAAPVDWSGLVWVWFLALMTTPCPTLPDELVGSRCRYVEGLNSKQSLLTVNTCGDLGGSALWEASLSLSLPASHELLSEPCPFYHVPVRGHLWWEKPDFPFPSSQCLLFPHLQGLTASQNLPAGCRACLPRLFCAWPPEILPYPVSLGCDWWLSFIQQVLIKLLLCASHLET